MDDLWTTYRQPIDNLRTTYCAYIKWQYDSTYVPLVLTESTLFDQIPCTADTSTATRLSGNHSARLTSPIELRPRGTLITKPMPRPDACTRVPPEAQPRAEPSAITLTPAPSARAAYVRAVHTCATTMFATLTLTPCIYHSAHVTLKCTVIVSV